MNTGKVTRSRSSLQNRSLVKAISFLTAALILTTSLVQAGPLVDSSASPKKVIVGSWIETVTFSGPGAPPPLKSLATFAADGTMTVADQGSVRFASGLVFSAGHGSWVAQGDRTFSWTILELASDLNGNLLGTVKIRGTYTVDESGNAYSGVFKSQVLDPFGNVLFENEGSNAGTRIQVEPLP